MFTKDEQTEEHVDGYVAALKEERRGYEARLKAVKAGYDERLSAKQLEGRIAGVDAELERFAPPAEKTGKDGSDA
jgi:uncharacterized small protein (DUF1192 family)